MKHKAITPRTLLFIAFAVVFNPLVAKWDDVLETDALLVEDKSVVLNDEEVSCTVSIGKSLQYQACAGGLFPLRRSGQAGHLVEGVLGFQTGGVRIPPAFTEFPVQINLVAFEAVPLYILASEANIVRGCGFTHDKLALQSKILGSDRGIGYLLVELSSHIQFNQDFKKVPTVTVSLNTVFDGPLAPLFAEDLAAGSQIFMLVNAQGYAADATTDGFTLTILLYFHVFAPGGLEEGLVILPSTLLNLNNSVDKIINVSQVSFQAVGE